MNEEFESHHAVILQVKDAAGSVKSAAGSAGEKAKDLVGQGYVGTTFHMCILESCRVAQSCITSVFC